MGYLYIIHYLWLDKRHIDCSVLLKEARFWREVNKTHRLQGNFVRSRTPLSIFYAIIIRLCQAKQFEMLLKSAALRSKSEFVKQIVYYSSSKVSHNFSVHNLN